MKRIIRILATMMALVGCGSQKFTTLSPDDFQTTVADKNIQLVDVRTAEEYAEQHIPGAVNIDVYAEDFIEQCKAKLDASRPVAVSAAAASGAQALRRSCARPASRMC